MHDASSRVCICNTWLESRSHRNNTPIPQCPTAGLVQRSLTAKLPLDAAATRV